MAVIYGRYNTTIVVKYMVYSHISCYIYHKPPQWLHQPRAAPAAHAARGAHAALGHGSPQAEDSHCSILRTERNR